jgi:MFS transporter, DHA1 family, inner membrane transport protein
MAADGSRRTLWALLFGNLVIGTGVLLPAGLLTAIMTGIGVSAAEAGLLLTVGGLVVGFGAPILAGLTSRIDRRILLVIALALYVVGHVAAALTANLTLLLVFRALTVAGAAIFTPQAAATAALIVPPERRSSAIAFIFIGWSLASVIGIPLGSLLGAAIGWQETYLLMAALSALAALAVWLVLPGGLKVQRLDLAAWLGVLTNPRLLVVLAVTMFSMSGQFTLFTYVSPILAKVYGLEANGIALVFLAVGVAGVLGNFTAARVATGFGVENSILLALASVAAGLAVIWIGWGALWTFVLGGCLWGLGGFAANSLQQSRLVALAPALASATVALNTSAVYLGQSLGSASGAALIADGAGPDMAMAGCAFAVTAMLLSVLAARMGRLNGQAR